jgi:hypothetical protein
MSEAEKTSGTPRWVVAAVIVALVVVAAVVMIIAGSGGKDEAKPSSTPSSAGSPAGSSAVETITTIPASAYDQAGVDAVDPSLFVALPAGEPPLEQGGKPEVLYIGAEFCPFCAGERWAVVAALSRFGEFTGLQESQSSTEDVYPGTKTVTFHGSDYTSDYVAFTAVETQTSEGAPLDTPTAEQEAIIGKYDAPPYVDAQSAGAIPFLDIANAYVVVGSTVPVDELQGMSADEIATAAADPKNHVGTTVLGSANMISAIICSETGGQPAEVCTSSGVQAGTEALGL